MNIIELDKKYDKAKEKLNGDDISQGLIELSDIADEYIIAAEYLGYLYGFGEHLKVDKDLDKAHFYLEKAWSRGDEYARFLWGMIEMHSGNEQAAVDTFNIGVDADYAPSMYWLSRIIGASKEDSFFDKKKSLLLCKVAADKGHVYSKGLYLRRIVLGEYGIKSFLKVPQLFFQVLYGLVKYRKSDPEHKLVW